MPLSKYQLEKQKDRDTKILDLYKTGITLRQLGKTFDCSHATIFNAVKRAESEIPTEELAQS